MEHDTPTSASPILVTGAHRTGTTWVGKMLAATPQVAYISEPLNVLHRPGVYGAPISYWYTYITEENESSYLPAFQKTLAYRYDVLAELRSLRSGRDMLRMMRDFYTFTVGRLQKRRPLLKDPFAVFSIEWFAKRLNCRVVITVRHPAAFASSLKRLGWSFNLQKNLFTQPLLVRDHLEIYRQALEAEPPKDLIERAAWLWRIIYRTVWEITQQHPISHSAPRRSGPRCNHRLSPPLPCPGSKIHPAGRADYSLFKQRRKPSRAHPHPFDPLEQPRQPAKLEKASHPRRDRAHSHPHGGYLAVILSGR